MKSARLESTYFPEENEKPSGVKLKKSVNLITGKTTYLLVPGLSEKTDRLSEVDKIFPRM